MIYTSNYFNKATEQYTRVRISASAPTGATYEETWLTVAPDWRTLLKPYKEGQLTDDEYTGIYLAKLEAQKEIVINELQALLTKHKDIVLLCWCGKNKFCHRRLLADWLTKQGFGPIQEI